MYVVIHGYPRRVSERETAILTLAGDEITVPDDAIKHRVALDTSGREDGLQRIFIEKDATVEVQVTATALPRPDDTWVKDYFTDFKYADDGGTVPKSFDETIGSRGL
jgi:hypothetical protein